MMGLRKNIVKALDKIGKVILYLLSKFPDLSDDVVITQGVFVSLQIRQVMCDENFGRKLNSAELAIWKCLKFLVRGFLANRKE